MFFWPTMFTTLSDPPSSLCLLNGIWLLLLSGLVVDNKRPWLIILAGLFIGAAVWIRAFYLYPVLAGVIIGNIAILFSPQRKFRHCLLLCALILPGYQFFKTYQAIGELAYLDGDRSSYWTDIHLKSTNIGMDTLFQYRQYSSAPRYCNINFGLRDAVQQRDYASLLCLLENRAAFYLATYRSATYIYPNIKNQLYAGGIENVGLETVWTNSNLDWKQDVAMDPAGGMTADEMTVQSAKPDGGTSIQQTVSLQGDTDYTFSIWLWSDEPATIQLSFKRQGDDSPLSTVMASVTKEPQRFSMSSKSIDFGNYSVRIGAPTTISTPIFGGSMSDTLYAWGAQLEKGTVMTEYAGIEPLLESDIRPWHPYLLLANSLALILALLNIIRFRQIYLLEPAGLMAVTIVGAVFAEALVIIPEQRFVATFMVFMWLLASAQVFFWLINMLCRKTPQPPAP